MKPLSPQPDFSLNRLARSVLTCGVIALGIFFISVSVAYVHREYRWGFRRDGLQGVADDFAENMKSPDSDFLLFLKLRSPIACCIPIAVGGIVGVFHYVYVRKRRRLSGMVQE